MNQWSIKVCGVPSDSLMHTFPFPHSHIPIPPYLFHLLELEVEPPQAEPCLQLWDGAQCVEELLRRAQGNVRLRGPGLRYLRPLIIRRHQFSEQLLHHLASEVGVVHADDGRLDVPGGRKPLDLDEDVVGSPLVQNCQCLALLCVRLKWGRRQEEGGGGGGGGGEGQREM